MLIRLVLIKLNFRQLRRYAFGLALWSLYHRLNSMLNQFVLQRKYYRRCENGSVDDGYRQDSSVAALLSRSFAPSLE